MTGRATAAPRPGRRDFLRGGVLGLGGLGLDDLLRVRAASAEPVRPTDFLATVYAHFGIDPRRDFRDFGGHSLSILPDGEPIRELTI